jgi:hypothetical protein
MEKWLDNNSKLYKLAIFSIIFLVLIIIVTLISFYFIARSNSHKFDLTEVLSKQDNITGKNALQLIASSDLEGLTRAGISSEEANFIRGKIENKELSDFIEAGANEKDLSLILSSGLEKGNFNDINLPKNLSLYPDMINCSDPDYLPQSPISYDSRKVDSLLIILNEDADKKSDIDLSNYFNEYFKKNNFGIKEIGFLPIEIKSKETHSSDIQYKFFVLKVYYTQLVNITIKKNIQERLKKILDESKIKYVSKIDYFWDSSWQCVFAGCNMFNLDACNLKCKLSEDCRSVGVYCLNNEESIRLNNFFLYGPNDTLASAIDSMGNCICKNNLCSFNESGKDFCKDNYALQIQSKSFNLADRSLKLTLLNKGVVTVTGVDLNPEIESEQDINGQKIKGISNGAIYPLQGEILPQESKEFILTIVDSNVVNVGKVSIVSALIKKDGKTYMCINNEHLGF